MKYDTISKPLIKVLFLLQLLLTSQLALCESLQAETADKKRVKETEININELIEKVNQISHEYYKTENQLLRSPGLASKRVQGYALFIDVFDKNTKITKKYKFIKGSISSLTVADDTQNGFQLHYYDNGIVSAYMEIKKSLPDGIYLHFYKNGKVQNYIEFKGGKYFGRLMTWNESGELIESIMHKEPKEIGKIKAPQQTGKDKK